MAACLSSPYWLVQVQSALVCIFLFKLLLNERKFCTNKQYYCDETGRKSRIRLYCSLGKVRIIIIILHFVFFRSSARKISVERDGDNGNNNHSMKLSKSHARITIFLETRMSDSGYWHYLHESIKTNSPPSLSIYFFFVLADLEITNRRLLTKMLWCKY